MMADSRVVNLVPLVDTGGQEYPYRRQGKQPEVAASPADGAVYRLESGWLVASSRRRHAY